MKDIIITKLSPRYTTVITTLDCYEEDVVLDGVIVSPRGALKLYQKVISVGDSVRGIKEGDLVLLDLKNYKEKKYRDDSVKGDIEKMEEIEVYNFPKIFIAGQIYGKFQDRDIEGVIESYEEVEVQTSTSSNKLL